MNEDLDQNCFLNPEKLCNAICKAYRMGPEENCRLLQVAVSFSAYLDSLTRGETTKVKYPASPPAPEVR